MSYEITGTLEKIGDTTRLSETFTKREFVVQTQRTGKDGTEYVNYVKFQLFNNNCDLMNSLSEGNYVTVYFNIGGKKYNENGDVKYFTDLTAWKVDNN